MLTSETLACEKLFNPAAVAVVGASQNLRSLGSRYLKVLKEFGYRGTLYAVNPRAESSFDVPGYRHLIDIPGPIDFCVIVVPAPAVADVVTACVAKAVPVAQILTGGFGEASADGQRAEQALLEAAAGQTRLVGPNCMGVYSSRGGLTFVGQAPTARGGVSIASQSGGISLDLVLQAKTRGLALSKVVSMGNCIDLGAEAFLRYFDADATTEVIGLYLEGLRDGRTFLPTLTKVAGRKPVVILKGGRTGLGARSVASHTNVLAGEHAIWKAAVTQAGAVLVETVDDFLAVLTALQPHVPRPCGSGVALVGNGGGSTVLATDVVVECGLTLAPLQPQSQTALAAIPMPPGATVGNPTDTPLGALNTSGAASLGQVMQVLLQDDEVHSLVVHFNFAPFLNYDNRHDLATGVATALGAISSSHKPIYVALRGTAEPAIEALRHTILATTDEVGLPCFLSVHEAVKTLATVYQWGQLVASRSRHGAVGDAQQ